LINPKIAERIAVESGITKDDTVLEIGPGTGKLTEHLLKRAKKVVAVEKDRDLFEELHKKFKKEIEANTLVLACEDILKFDIKKTILGFLSGPRPSGSLSQPDHSKNPKQFFYKVVANIPYNITGAILKKFLAGSDADSQQPDSLTFLVQREVAERIMAKDGKESLLSISVKAYGVPRILFRVGKGNFYPSPKVDSAVITIQKISREIFKKHKIDEEKFWKIVRAGFAHKRKKLKGNLKNIISDKNSQFLVISGKRAEDLSLKEWINLAK